MPNRLEYNDKKAALEEKESFDKSQAEEELRISFAISSKETPIK